jgi:hypothetical protein
MELKGGFGDVMRMRGGLALKGLFFLSFGMIMSKVESANQ